ncbi:MAG: type 4a pilus biogenesis protein PilO [Myxococcales bacterium]|jgi:type IV pilus assembly protein PilO|nr:type 4a pilus biogenesis protein PilO [Myxococcales bacterium]
MAATKKNSFEQLPLSGRIALLFLILALVSVGYATAIHFPLDADIESAKRRYTQLQDELARAETKQRAFLALQQELAEREVQDRELKKVLPQKAEMAVFLESLNQTAELSGLRIERVEPRPEEAGELYVRIPVALQLKGRYLQLAKFFYNVSQLQRAINMENISLSEPRVNESDEVELKVSVRATTFRQPDLPQGAK